MPTYQYQCTEGHRFERLQKMSDAALKKCPTCGAKAERQISGGSGLIFKGSGFYITDYGKDGKGPRKDKEGSSTAEKPSTESAPSKSSETAAPAATAAPAPKSAPASGGDA